MKLTCFQLIDFYIKLPPSSFSIAEFVSGFLLRKSNTLTCSEVSLVLSLFTVRPAAEKTRSERGPVNAHTAPR